MVNEDVENIIRNKTYYTLKDDGSYNWPGSVKAIADGVRLYR